MLNLATRYQGGQAMSEFIVAMALFLPLFVGMVYVGKYADIKHQAIQASRYAAFEQALDPRSQHESANNASVLIEETKARFFTDGSRNSGKIGFQDTTAQLSTSGTLNPVWNELDGTPMIANYADVSVTLKNSSLDDLVLKPVDVANSTFFNLDGNGQFEADVEVSPANIAHFAPFSNINLKIGATTVVAGDAWNAAGAADVASTITNGTLPGGAVPARALGKVQSLINTLLQPLFYLFAGDLFSPTKNFTPQIGCIRPDVTPSGTAPGANYQPGDTCY